ncbi:hypothetical protein J3458_000168 [Metarhizium acridum]|uniref:uncharacterized protein n=1 Tax=Metarhizium acridum TaxID=92637 RepID=UPI001C6BD7A2|nr:hypothetical protein J3458_000168 [Metarhizium acridum]
MGNLCAIECALDDDANHGNVIKDIRFLFCSVFFRHAVFILEGGHQCLTFRSRRSKGGGCVYLVNFLWGTEMGRELIMQLYKGFTKRKMLDHFVSEASGTDTGKKEGRRGQQLMYK